MIEHRDHHMRFAHKLLRDHLELLADISVEGDMLLIELSISDDIFGIDTVEDLSIGGDLCEDLFLRTRIIAWEDSRCVIIDEEMSSYLEVEFAWEESKTFLDGLSLECDILLSIKSDGGRCRRHSVTKHINFCYEKYMFFLFFASF